METQTRITPYLPGAGRLMVTNNGPHPAEAWAQVTAEHLAPLGPDVTGHRRLKALELQAKIANAIEEHHQSVQDTERAKLAADTDHIMVPPDASAHLDAGIAAIQAAAKGTEWEANFQDTARLALIRQELAAHFASSQPIEKSWHADKNPTAQAAVAFRAQHHPGA
jgi:hypothetical protein